MDGKPTFIVLVVVVILLVLIIVGIGLLLLFNGMKPADSVAASQTTVKVEETTKAEITQPEKAVYYRPFGTEGENINLKIADDKVVHIVRVGVDIATPDEKTGKELSLRESKIKAMIIDIFNKLTFDDITKDPDIKVKITDKLLVDLNKMFENKIAEVSIYKWMYQ